MKEKEGGVSKDERKMKVKRKVREIKIHGINENVLNTSGQSRLDLEMKRELKKITSCCKEVGGEQIYSLKSMSSNEN